MGKILSNERIVDLTEDEKQKLKKSFSVVKGFLIVGIIVELIFIIFFFYNWDNWLIGVVVFVVISGATMLSILKMSIYKDIQAGKKIMLTGIVEEKRNYTYESTEYYTLQIGSKSYNVKKELWDMAEVKQKVEIAVLFHSKSLIDLKVID